MGVGSICGVDSASVRGIGNVPGECVRVNDGDADDMSDAGAGSLGVGSVDVMSVDGLVLAQVTSWLPWTEEVAYPQASCAAFRGNSHASQLCDSGHILVKRGEKRSCWPVGRG